MSEAASDKGGFGNGFVLGIGLCIVQVAATLGVAALAGNQKELTVFVLGLMYFSLIQLIYVVPLFFFLRKRMPAAATGLAIAASLVALVNIACAAKVNLR